VRPRAAPGGGRASPGSPLVIGELDLAGERLAEQPEVDTVVPRNVRRAGRFAARPADRRLAEELPDAREDNLKRGPEVQRSDLGKQTLAQAGKVRGSDLASLGDLKLDKRRLAEGRALATDVRDDDPARIDERLGEDPELGDVLPMETVGILTVLPRRRHQAARRTLGRAVLDSPQADWKIHAGKCERGVVRRREPTAPDPM
jgi:hypothetical protein